ncbi:MAG: hypothetical protein JO136_06545 [Hyphomicrobiales bacterium]|nr:hypothetical protein [Hyphomicrobiales bacterium]
MIKPSSHPGPEPDTEPKPRAQRSTRIARREGALNLIASGYAYIQIAKIARTSIATVWREIEQALTERPREAPKRSALAPVARLIKALRLAGAAVELGELKAAAAYLWIAAALDRYHELARGSPLPSRSIEPQSQAPPAESQAAASNAAPDNDAIEEAQHSAQTPER